MSEHDPLENDENDATSDESVEEQELYETVGPSSGVSRRGFLKAAGVAGATAATGSAYYGSPVGEAEAIDPSVAVGGVVGGPVGVAVSWALREITADGADAPPEGLSASALKEQWYQTAKTRHSTNASTFIDNQNIAEAGVENAAYADGKVAAIEALNEQKPQADVESAALGAVDPYESTVKTNLLKTWNESALELATAVDNAQSHSNVQATELFDIETMLRINDNYGGYPPDEFDIRLEDSQMEMPDGSTFTLKVLVLYAVESDNELWAKIDPINGWREGDEQTYTGDRYFWRNEPIHVQPPTSDADVVTYLKQSEWTSIWNTLDTAFQNARDGLLLWVDNIYDQVQAGELDTSELLTPRELAEMTASEEDSFNQAVADLQALNVSTDLNREAEIYIPDTNATLFGTLASTRDKTFEAGTTITPSSDDADYYLTYDVSKSSGTWEAYDAASGVDGGIVTFTSEPPEGHEFKIKTTAGETATVLASDFSKVEGSQEWTVDITDQLETAITDIESIEFGAAVDETQWETIKLDSEFEIITFTDTETGEEKDTATTESSEPQSDDNYITEEEWQKMRERQEDLIEKYEESQSGGGIAGFFDGGGSIPMGGVAGLIVAGLVYLGLNDR